MHRKTILKVVLVKLVQIMGFVNKIAPKANAKITFDVAPAPITLSFDIFLHYQIPSHPVLQIQQTVQ